MQLHRKPQMNASTISWDKLEEAGISNHHERKSTLQKN